MTLVRTVTRQLILPEKPYLVHLSDSNQQVPSDATWTKCTFDTVAIDQLGAADLSNNRLYLPAGTYHVLGLVDTAQTSGTGSNRAGRAAIYLNGSEETTYSDWNDDNFHSDVAVAWSLSLQIANGDYLELYGMVVLNGGAGPQINDKQLYVWRE